MILGFYRIIGFKTPHKDHFPPRANIILFLPQLFKFPRMKKYSVSVFCMVLAILQSCSKDDYDEMENPNSLTISVSTNIQSEIENQLFDLINEHRNSKGLSPFLFESTSYYYAQNHNDYMITMGAISHANFDVRANNISSKTGAVKVSENVAKDYDTVEEAFNAWIESSVHRENIEGNFTHSALSIKSDSTANLYFTQIFIR